MNEQTIGCIVMAAGHARRFGSNKLLAELEGQPLIRRALEAIPPEKLHTVLVVTQYDFVADMAAEYGFIAVKNLHPEAGISHTIALGLQALPHVDAAMFMVADQPYLQRRSVADLIDFYRQAPDMIAAVSHGGIHGNPCLFPARFFSELQSLRGDCGGSAIIRQHPEALRLWEVDARQLQDIDTPQQLPSQK